MTVAFWCIIRGKSHNKWLEINISKLFLIMSWLRVMVIWTEGFASIMQWEYLICTLFNFFCIWIIYYLNLNTNFVLLFFKRIYFNRFIVIWKWGSIIQLVNCTVELSKIITILISFWYSSVEFEYSKLYQ